MRGPTAHPGSSPSIHPIHPSVRPVSVSRSPTTPSTPLILVGAVVLVLGQNSKSQLSHSSLSFTLPQYLVHATRDRAHAKPFFPTRIRIHTVGTPVRLLHPPLTLNTLHTRVEHRSTLKLFCPRFWFPNPGEGDGLIRERVRGSTTERPHTTHHHHPLPKTQANPAQSPAQSLSS